jgi:hypothetical protein
MTRKVKKILIDEHCSLMSTPERYSRDSAVKLCGKGMSDVLELKVQYL